MILIEQQGSTFTLRRGAHSIVLSTDEAALLLRAALIQLGVTSGRAARSDSPHKEDDDDQTDA